MKKSKRFVSAMLVSALAISSLTACGQAKPQETPAATSQSTATEGSTTASDTKAPAVSSEPVTLRFSWWGNDDRHERTLKVIEMYQEKNPNVTIEPEYRGKSEREKVATELGSGTSADIVQLNPPWMGDFVANGDFFVDLSQYSFDLAGFDKNLIEDYCTYNGTLITMPSGLNARSFLMNKTKLDDMGIKMGLDQLWTWDDIHEIGKTVHEKNPEMYFLNLDKIDMVEFVMRPYMIQKTGKFLISDDFELGFAREDLVDALNYVTKLYDDGVAVPASEGNTFLNAPWTNPDWINGNLTAMLSWTSLLAGAVSDSQDVCMEAKILNEEVIKATQYAQENAGLYENTASTNAEISAILQDAVETVSYDSGKVEAAADQAMKLIEDILSTLKQ